MKKGLLMSIVVLIGFIIMFHTIMNSVSIDLEQNGRDYCSDKGGLKELGRAFYKEIITCNDYEVKTFWFIIDWEYKDYETKSYDVSGERLKKDIKNVFTFLIPIVIICCLIDKYFSRKENKQ